MVGGATAVQRKLLSGVGTTHRHSIVLFRTAECVIYSVLQSVSYRILWPHCHTAHIYCGHTATPHTGV